MNRYLQAATVADALSLGSHWVYDQKKLARIYPDGIHEFTDPVSSYHPNRKAGELTHYGDQMQLLETSLRKRGRLTADGWRQDWVEGMEGYDGYRDGATKETLKTKGEQPSNSDDLAGASRLAPILDLAMSNEEKIAAARAQTVLTHGDPSVADAAEFFVRATLSIEGGASFLEAFRLAGEQGNYAKLNVSEHLQKAQAAGEDFLAAGKEFGLTCHTAEAFPLALYLSLRPGASFDSAMSENGLVGGDTSARSMLMALLFAARDGEVGESLVSKLATREKPTEPGSHRVRIAGPSGILAGVLEIPKGEPKAYAIFAHCFTCGKNFSSGVRITKGLAEQGIATLRIDFSGLGNSDGEFSDSSFLTNLDDLTAASDWLRKQYSAPRLLIGHSLGGAAVLAASARIKEVMAVVTIGAPAEPQHVTRLFGDHLAEIENEGEAQIQLADRSFKIGKRFLDDLQKHQQATALAELRGIETLIMHSPEDEVVPLVNAGEIYSALRHPKSFIALAGANHLLTREQDTDFVVDLINVWATRVFQSGKSA